MEVHSPTRRLREDVTLASTSSLMVFEVLLSLRWVNQKNEQRKAILSLRACDRWSR